MGRFDVKKVANCERSVRAERREKVSSCLDGGCVYVGALDLLGIDGIGAE